MVCEILYFEILNHFRACMHVRDVSDDLVTPMCISQDLGCIWPDKVYICGACNHIRPSRVVCMSSM